jgi:hypothetical protein
MIYVTERVFIRPQFDYHYVPGLNNQFGQPRRVAARP